MTNYSYNTDYNVNSVGRPFPAPERPIGPCITGVIDCRDQLNPLDGFVIEEGTVPLALAQFYQAMLELMPGQIAPTGQSVFQKVESLLARQGSKILGPYFRQGSVEKTQVYLIMSHDSTSPGLSLIWPLIRHQATKQPSRSKMTSPCSNSWVSDALST